MSNPFTNNSARLKCSVTPEYDPCLPWLSVLDNAIIIDTIIDTYVDDERIHANSEI